MGFRIAACYLLDAQFVADVAKFISGAMCCLSAMTALELPHVNVLSKCDLLPSKHALETFLEADANDLKSQLDATTNRRFHRLNSFSFGRCHSCRRRPWNNQNTGLGRFGFIRRNHHIYN